MMRERVVFLTLCVLIATLVVRFRTLTIRAVRVPVLPVLTPSNSERWPEWHAYYEEVYGVPVQAVVDLNTCFYKQEARLFGCHRRSMARGRTTEKYTPSCVDTT